MPQKNPMFLLRVMKILKDKYFPFHLELYGTGTLQDQMEAYINENELNAFITIKGPKIDLQDILIKKDLLLLTSNYEGFGLVIVEAYSQSVPVITTPWGEAVNEIVINNKIGIIINNFNEEEYASSLMKLLSNKEQLKEMKRMAYEESKNYEESYIAQYWIKNILS